MTGTNLSAAVCQSVTTGQSPTFTLADIQAANTAPNTHALVTLDVGSLTSVGFQQVAGLFTGHSIPDLVPPALTNIVDVLTAALTLDTVSYELLPDNTLATIGVSLGLVTPPTFTLFGDADLTVSVASVDLSLANPASSPTLSMVLNGTLALGAKAGVPTLNVSLFVPELNLVAAMPSAFTPLPVSDFLTPLGIGTTLFDSMAVEVFTFELDVLSEGLMLEVGLVDPPSPTANTDGFTLQSASFALEIGSGQLSLAVASTILVEVAASQKSLAFDADLTVVATRTPGSPLTPTWTITGALDVPATLAAQTLTGTTLTLTQLLAILGLSPPASALLDTDAVTLGTLTLDCRYTAGTAPLFGLSGSVGVAWAGLGGITLDAAFTFSHQSGATPATQGSVTVDATIDGFAVTLEYQFGGSQGSTLTASAFGGTLTGTYTAGTETLTLVYAAAQGTQNQTAAPPITLAQVIDDFIAMFTGDTATALPDPWGSFFSDVTIPLESVSITVDFATKSAQITLTLDKASLLGLSVTGVTLSYQSGKGFALTVQGDFSDLLGTASPSWDPTQPGAAPAVPGTGSGNLQVNLLAIGQRMTLATPPATVSDAVSALSALLQKTGGSTLPGFSAGAGWTVALDLLLRGQLDVQLVFLDGTPTGLYGAQVTVTAAPAKGSGGSGYLNQLAGLQAEIQYSTISSTLAEYQGVLVPPASFKDLQVGMCSLQLPSISARFYTDGEFYVDLGFPTGGDFSQSFGITAPPYQGYGGLYFGRLSPSQASNLPTVTGGSFSTETEIGIGLKLGLYEGWSKGPLTASLSATLSGIFQGVFAEYTAQSGNGAGGSQEYWCIEATVAVDGEVTGSVDFTVIAASLDVAVSVSVDVLATAGYAFPVSIDATLAVSLSVTINLGIVHISHSFAFSTALAETVTVGTTQAGLPWPAAASVGAAVVGAATAPPSPALPAAAGATTGPTFAPFAGFQLPIALCVTPVLSQALNAQQAAEWVYVAETTVPASPNQGQSTDAATFDDVAQLVVAWFAQAVLGGSVTAGTDPRTALTLTLAQIQQLETALQGMRKTPTVPAASDVQAFFAKNLVLTLQSVFNAAPQGDTTQPVPTVPFPLPPTCSVVVSQISTTATSLLQSQPQAVPTAAAPDGPAPAVLRDYLILVALSSLGSLQTVATTAAQSVSALFTALGGGADNIAGMVSRFMLHGQQLGSGPLYNATGQISLPFTPNSQETLTVSITSPSPSSYGLVFPNTEANGTGQIVLASSDPDAVVYSGQTISGWAGLAPTEGAALAAGLMPETATVPRRYRLGTGTQVVAQAGGSSVAVLRPLPTALRQALAAAGGLSGVSLADPSSGDAVAASTYAWAVQVEFSVRALPAAGQEGAPVYAVHTVSASGLPRLQALYADLAAATPPVALTGLTLAVPVKDAGGAGSSARTVSVRQVDVGSGGAILYQSQQAVPGTPDAAAFIATLLAAGLEQERGFILYVPNQDGAAVIPPALFDGHGVAHLTLVASLSHSTAADSTETLRPYVTAVVASTQAPAQPLSIAAPALTETVRRVPLGSVRMWQTNSATPANPPIAYQPTIDNLFSLVAFYPTVTDGGTTICSGTTPVIVSQVNSGASDGTSRHTASFSILQHVEATAALAQPSVQSPDLPALLSLAADPYQFVGNVFSAETKWVDLFGNMLPVRSAAGSIAGQILQWTDPLIGLQGWPGLSVSYSFATAAGGDRVLSLALSWSQPSSLSAERVGELVGTLVRAYHQLSHVSASLSTSLVPTPLNALLEFVDPPTPAPSPYPVPPQTVAGALQSRLTAILEALVAGTGTAPVLPPLQFVLPADSAFNAAPLYRLSATLDFALSLPPSLSGNQPFTTQTILPPLQTGSGTGIATARAFATAIETVLSSQSLVLFLGAGGGRIPDFWVLRWGAGGVDLAVSGASWQGYAPAPLSPQLFSGPVPLSDLPALVDQFLQSYAGGAVLPATGTVANLDCDAEMRRVLAKLDRLLAPGVAVPALATAATAPAVAAMTALKSTLSSTLSAGAVSLTDGSKAPAPVAAALQEAMRTKAEAFYDIDAVATLAVTTAALTGLGGVVLSGRLLPDGNQPAGLTLGRVSGTITGGLGTLTVTLSGGRRLALDSATLPGTFRIDAIQVNVTTLPVDTSGALPPGPTALTCRQGEWLRAVNPPGPTLTVPASVIGLPRRTHPTAPVLRSQTATPNAGSGDALQTAKGWALSAEYHHRPVPQDTVLARIVVNGATETATAGNVAGGLPMVLAMHSLVSPLLQSHGLAALQPYGFTLSAQSEGAIQSFAALCGTMAANLPSAPETVTAGQDTVSGPLVYSFEISEGPQSTGSTDLQSPWLVEVRQAGTAGAASDLAVGIPGYTPVTVSATAGLAVYSYSAVADGTPLTAAAGVLLGRRTLSMTGLLDVVGAQSAQLFLSVERNKYLWSQTASPTFPTAFLLTTGSVSFPNPARPFFTCTTPIAMTALSGMPASGGLVPYLSQFLQELVSSAMTGVTLPNQMTVQLVVSLETRISPALPPVVTPIAMTLDIGLAPNVSAANAGSWATLIADQVNGWVTGASTHGYAPGAQPWSTASLLFQVTLIAPTQTPELPVLVLRSVTLPLSSVTSLQS